MTSRRSNAILRAAVAISGIAAFAALYVWVLADIWRAGATPPTLNTQLLYAATVLGGIIGTGFAVVVGVQRQDPEQTPRDLRLGGSMVDTPTNNLPPAWLRLVADISVWVYGAVGAACLITVGFHNTQSPAAVKTIASVFAGYFIAILGSIYRAE